MTEREVLNIIEQELRRSGLPVFSQRSKEAEALRRAAVRIASDALTNQQQAARTASQAGYAITRGRTRF
jgi:hypothetical protein